MTALDAFPTLGVVVEELRVEDSMHVIRLSSTFPNHQRFERRSDGQNWETVGEVGVVPVGACRVEYRSVDPVGTVGAITMIDVWLPRGEGFVESGLPGGVRRQAPYCS